MALQEPVNEANEHRRRLQRIGKTLPEYFPRGDAFAPLHRPPDRLEVELALGAEVVLDGGDVDPGGVRDLTDADGRKAPPAEELLRRVEQRPPGVHRRLGLGHGPQS